MKILEINNIDLPGKVFNGYDLQKFINENTKHTAKQMVIEKLSKDKNVITFFKKSLLSFQNLISGLENEIMSVHSQLSITSPALLKNKDFCQADLVHYHLIHNTKLSLKSLINLCAIKPSIISIHDPWFFTGRCVHPESCEKWLNGCNNCQYLSTLFPFKEDNCKYLWKLKKKVYSNLDVDYIVSTPFMLDMFKKSPLTKKSNRVHLIPFGIDLKKYSNSMPKEDARHYFSIPSDEVVLFFRAQKDFKGTSYLVEALSELESDKKITLLSCGETGIIDNLKQKYNVIELGYIGEEEVIRAMNACDVFLMPSIGESFGLMAIEAMACSKPVVVFNNTALPSVTFAPKCGVLVENKNSIKLMEAIKWMIDDEKERVKRGKLGRKLAEEHYDVDKYNQKILDLYLSISRRKHKKIMNNSPIKIDYSQKGIQELIKKLKKIVSIIFCERIPNFSFLKHEDMSYLPDESRIDYSLDEVQEVLDIFNYELYDYCLKEGNQLSGIKHKTRKFLYLFKNDKGHLKKMAVIHLKKHPIMYSVTKKIYKIKKKFFKTFRKK